MGDPNFRRGYSEPSFTYLYHQFSIIATMCVARPGKAQPSISLPFWLVVISELLLMWFLLLYRYLCYAFCLGWVGSLFKKPTYLRCYPHGLGHCLPTIYGSFSNRHYLF